MGSLLGTLFGYLLSLRARARRAQEDEFERINRLKMRHFIGEVAPPFSNTVLRVSPGFCRIYSQANDADEYKSTKSLGLPMENRSSFF